MLKRWIRNWLFGDQDVKLTKLSPMPEPEPKMIVGWKTATQIEKDNSRVTRSLPDPKKAAQEWTPYFSYSTIGNYFDINPSMVGHIKAGKFWKNAWPVSPYTLEQWEERLKVKSTRPEPKSFGRLPSYPTNKKQRQYITKQHYDEIRRMADEGYMQKAICEKLNVSSSVVSRAARGLKVKIR